MFSEHALIYSAKINRLQSEKERSCCRSTVHQIIEYAEYAGNNHGDYGDLCPIVLDSDFLCDFSGAPKDAPNNAVAAILKSFHAVGRGLKFDAGYDDGIMKIVLSSGDCSCTLASRECP
ncbi:uncharacterized protein PHALS_13984 [Plasmopara halstedii]|uniref:Uncharacterized protein n=1 Tax=Plasmopara halstedii TaxID=4781 RepID=A0A0P1AQM6_PLAHL|nr:uncharacterized protein PHALS_13984 [Plasmopara halstedii]CEG43689.1 hypothetical protein PHALS_13984 [Plasmopara halstedii]|eukprot:XP_024580058.1 hypothetical protein PHALS_13984 [Plasmopara halstedii]